MAKQARDTAAVDRQLPRRALALTRRDGRALLMTSGSGLICGGR